VETGIYYHETAKGHVMAPAASPPVPPPGFLEHFVQLAEPYIRLGEIVALILAAIAIWFAVRQFRDSKELMHNAGVEAARLKSLIGQMGTVAASQEEKFRAVLEQADLQTRKLEAVADSLPTKFVGTFPNNLQAILDMVETARDEVVVVADFVGYGSYSDPVRFSHYFSVLRRKVVERSITLRVICYDRTRGSETLRLQFPDGSLESERKSHVWGRFFKDYFPDEPEPGSDSDFRDRLWEWDDDYRDNLFKNGASIKLTDDPLPFLLWLKDGRELIVSYQNATLVGDFSFQSSDKDFVRFFQEQLALIDAREYSGKRNSGVPLLVNTKSGPV
jgi:hypothetical protein